MTTNHAHYTVLARRYRPQTFGDIVGQEHVAQSIQNAIRKGRVAHAYLFTGARGVGKTSMARILAKALNCPQAVDGIPCHTCDICQGIAAGNDVDVLEIDGASNRGIDDIRALRANVNVKSMRTEYKIYIIDEVHMLTKEAFNALLKTLEEPPPKVKFVFCTTEPNKVPDTILSRCQRFDFSTVATANIAIRLSQIAEAEGISVSAAAIELVARRAAGSMRDSQSLFDQLLAFGGDEIGAEDVHRLMGTAPDDLLSSIVQSMINGQRDELLHVVDSALSAGVRLGELFDQLISYFRDLMVLAAGAQNVSLIGVSSDQRSTLQTQAGTFGIETIVAALQLLAETRARMQRVTFSRPLAELAFIRISLLENLDQLGPLMQALKTGPPLSVVTTLPAERPSSGAEGTQEFKTTSAVQSPVEPTELVNLQRDENPSQKPDKSPPATEEKKNLKEDNSAKEPMIQPASVADPINFKPGNENEVLSELISQSEDKVNQHLKGVIDSAISAPNRLDLLFPSSYSFSKKYCEEPEIRKQMERILRNITGQTVHLAFRIVETEEPASLRQTSSRPQRQPLEQCDDPFVNQAMSIFQAKIIDVRHVANPADTDEQH